MGLLKNIVKAAIGAKEFEFNVAGVSYTNDDGEDRQYILRKMKFGDGEFEKFTITLEKTTFDGRLAIAVYSNGHHLGYVPKDLTQKIDKAWKHEYMIADCQVKGNGKETPRGCTIKAVFR